LGTPTSCRDLSAQTYELFIRDAMRAVAQQLAICVIAGLLFRLSTVWLYAIIQWKY
jgi:hypothetical protein